MSELETKELRSRLMSWQLWAERQIHLGLLDVEQMPQWFNRASNTLREMIDKDKTIGSHCHYCEHKFLPGEKKETTNHIMFFHPGCAGKFDKEEKEALKDE